MQFLLVVFDGLRPDMVDAAATPHLQRFAALGTRFSHARSVFPSETRVCSASVATGCLPRRHGLVANRIADPTRTGATVDTGDVAALRMLQQALGTSLLGAPTLGERLAAAGRDAVILSSGTTGQTFVLNPAADALGQLTLSAHGPLACSATGRALFARVDPPPPHPADRAVWIAELFRTRFLPDPPAAAILWLCEPDTSGHYDGLGSAAQRAALQAADAAFGRILDDWQAGPHRETLHIAVASDHGQATITGHRDVAGVLPAAFADCQLIPGSSAGLLVPGGDASRIAELSSWLTQQNWAGAVYAADGAQGDGVLPRSLLLADHPRAAHILFTLRTAVSGAVLPGTTLHDGGLPLGGGTHGGLSPAELHTVLMLAGAKIRPGHVSALPAGLADIAPTALSLLGLPNGSMDGRVLAEAIVNGTGPPAAPAVETWEAKSVGYAQRLSRTRLGRHTYLDAGIRL